MSTSVQKRKRVRPLLGTFVEITLEGSLPIRALDRRIERAFAAIAKVDRLMSFHDPESDVSRLNQMAVHQPVQVHAKTYAVIQKALEFSRASGGVFDITVAPRLIEWEYLPGAADQTATHCSDRIALLPQNHVRFLQPLLIDLGGIAKGFAVDEAVRALQRWGVTSGCVNAGGDLRVFGLPQPVDVRHPANPGQRISLGTLLNRSAATTAAYFSRRLWKDRWVTPLIRPDGEPWMGSESVTVLAPDCLTADALTKIAAMASPITFQETCERYGAQSLVFS